MKRFSLGIVIFILAIALSAGGQKVFINDAQMLRDKTQMILDSAGKSPDEKTKIQLEDLTKSFERVEKRLNIVLCHSEIESIESNIISLKNYFKINDFSAFKVCCVQILSELENLIDSLKLTVENIL